MRLSLASADICSVQVWQDYFMNNILPPVPGQMMDIGLDHYNEFASLLKGFNTDRIVYKKLSFGKRYHVQILIIVTKMTTNGSD